MRSLCTILWPAFLAPIGAFLQQRESAPRPRGGMGLIVSPSSGAGLAALRFEQAWLILQYN